MTDEKTYRLKDPVTSFYDDETGLTVTRDEKVAIGPGAGKKTRAMIDKGGLVEVDGEAQPPTGSGATGTVGGDVLADDFPGKAELDAAGYKTLGSVLALSEEQLRSVKGVGPKKLEEIEKALEAHRK